jgi:hypothetical protein
MSWRDKIQTKTGKSVSKNQNLALEKVAPVKKKPRKSLKEIIQVESPEEKIQPEEVINNNNRFDPNKTYLVVGGKIKEISSKSKYLLDMLIIEEE